MQRCAVSKRSNSAIAPTVRSAPYHEIDGLLLGTAIETPMEVTVRLTVRKDRSCVKTPHFKTIHSSAQDAHYCTTGVDSDIREATRTAVRNMIQFLVAEYQMDRVDAYMLCSVAGDLKMHEVVSM
jgi:acetamidase/formamidase